MRPYIIFDLDGTLVDTAPDLAAVTDAILAQHGRPPVGIEAIRPMVGDGARRMLERGFEATGGLPGEAELQAAVAAYMVHYGEHIADSSLPFPGVVAALDALADQGCRLGVCTNKTERFAVKLLDALGLLGRFGAVVGGDTLPEKKPAAGHILGTLTRMGGNLDLAASEAVMVGDSINDVLAARAARVPVIAVSFGYTAIAPADLGADRLIDHFRDLRHAIAALDGFA